MDGFASGHSVIKITPNFHYYSKERNDLKPIVGVTLNKVSVSIESEWQQLGDSKVPLVQGIAGFGNAASEYTTLAGGGDIGAVWMSKQLWKKNGFLRIAPEFRIVDWDGTGRPLIAALQIAKFCLPGKPTDGIRKSLSEIGEYIANSKAAALGKTVGNYVGDTYSETTGYYGSMIKGKESDPNNMGMLFEGFKQELVPGMQSISKSLLDDVHDFITLKNAPPPVKIQIGQYFFHPDMIIKNASFNVSKEQSDLGPLYVDVTLDLETRKRISGIDDIGIVNVGKLAGRASIGNTDASNITQERLERTAATS